MSTKLYPQSKSKRRKIGFLMAAGAVLFNVVLNNSGFATFGSLCGGALAGLSASYLFVSFPNDAP
jgi:hypothetical protein